MKTRKKPRKTGAVGSEDGPKCRQQGIYTEKTYIVSPCSNQKHDEKRVVKNQQRPEIPGLGSEHKTKHVTRYK